MRAVGLVVAHSPERGSCEGEARYGTCLPRWRKRLSAGRKPKALVFRVLRGFLDDLANGFNVFANAFQRVAGGQKWQRDQRENDGFHGDFSCLTLK